ncbi:hypothetical protein ACFSLT_03465 [Novosphingobium resinovorum]
MELMVSYDGDKHLAARSLLNPLFVPSRLKANEAFMRAYADDMVREAVAAGGCELVGSIATPSSPWSSPICSAFPQRIARPSARSSTMLPARQHGHARRAEHPPSWSWLTTSRATSPSAAPGRRTTS